LEMAHSTLVEYSAFQWKYEWIRTHGKNPTEIPPCISLIHWAPLLSTCNTNIFIVNTKITLGLICTTESSGVWWRPSII
jgi:hypothetical protein